MIDAIFNWWFLVEPSTARLYAMLSLPYPRVACVDCQNTQLPGLKKSSALEYMLRWIPDLVRFPGIQDPRHQENIMAATVILRQYEEMEEEMDEGEADAEIRTDERVNFLAITQTIIDSMVASTLDCSDYSLATAAYWIVIRQEIYYALIRESVPHLRFDADRWRNASIANNVIMFAGEVATWRWGQPSSDE